MNDYRAGGAVNTPDDSFGWNHWQIIRECRRVANMYGFYGDALTDNQHAGTSFQESVFLALMQIISPKIKRLNRSFCMRVVRNIVLNSEVDE